MFAEMNGKKVTTIQDKHTPNGSVKTKNGYTNALSKYTTKKKNWRKIMKELNFLSILMFP